MRNSIIIEISGVYDTDFDAKILAPEFKEEMSGGTRVLFNGINELRTYQDGLLLDDESEGYEKRKAVKDKINVELDKALSEHKIVLDSIKAYATTLFKFIFNAEGHREDKLHILENVIVGIEGATNSWELTESIKEATFELGVLILSPKLTFMTFAHNDVDYDFKQITKQLVSNLQELRTNLVTKNI